MVAWFSLLRLLLWASNVVHHRNIRTFLFYLLLYTNMFCRSALPRSMRAHVGICFTSQYLFCVGVCACVDLRTHVCSSPQWGFDGDWYPEALFISQILHSGSTFFFLIINLPITPRLSLHLQPLPPSLHLSRHAPFSLNGVQTFGTYWTEQWAQTSKYTNMASWELFRVQQREMWVSLCAFFSVQQPIKYI